MAQLPPQLQPPQLHTPQYPCSKYIPNYSLQIPPSQYTPTPILTHTNTPPNTHSSKYRLHNPPPQVHTPQFLPPQVPTPAPNTYHIRHTHTLSTIRLLAYKRTHVNINTYSIHINKHLYSVQCTEYTVQCIRYSVQCNEYTLNCTMYNVHCTMYYV